METAHVANKVRFIETTTKQPLRYTDMNIAAPAKARIGQDQRSCQLPTKKYTDCFAVYVWASECYLYYSPSRSSYYKSFYIQNTGDPV